MLKKQKVKVVGLTNTRKVLIVKDLKDSRKNNIANTDEIKQKK